MKDNPASNYNIMANQAKKLFLTYSQPDFNNRFALKIDETFIYFNFFSEEYRIRRSDGSVLSTCSSGLIEAGFHETMIVLDMLCHSITRPLLSGQWKSISQLGGFIGEGHSGSSMLKPFKDFFTGRVDALSDACRSLGGIPASPGDVSFQFQVFDFFPVWFQFWDGDDEFPANIRFLWDGNTLEFLHYETLWYIMFLLSDRLRDLM